MSTPRNAPEHDVTLSIAVLDDDADFLEFVSAALGDAGHRVRTTSTPSALYEVNDAELPDLVLLDMNMGPHRGQDVLAELRKRWPRLCVIVVTGHPSLESMRETFRADVFDYLAKPFGIDRLHAAISEAAEALGLGQRPQDRLRRELGRHVRISRTERGWTLKELSESSGVSVSQLSSIERGAHLPSVESLLLIAHALGVEPSEWLRASGF
ncbi:MAG: response regulator [Planctomycetota bacterium]